MIFTLPKQMHVLKPCQHINPFIIDDFLSHQRRSLLKISWAARQIRKIVKNRIIILR